MQPTRFSEDVRAVTELKTRGAQIVDHVRRSRRPTLLTRRGHGVAVLVDLGEYERLVDRAGFIEGVEAGAKAVAAGEVGSNDEAMSILDTFGQPDGG